MLALWWSLTTADLITQTRPHAGLIVHHLLDLLHDAIGIFDEGNRRDGTSKPRNIAGMLRRIDVQDALPRT
jgi:hypothetical protein